MNVKPQKCMYIWYVFSVKYLGVLLYYVHRLTAFKHTNITGIVKPLLMLDIVKSSSTYMLYCF